MWTLAGMFADEERSRGVLQGFLGGALDRLAGTEPQRVITLALRIFGRISDGPGAEEVRRLALGIIAGLSVWRNVDDGRTFCTQVLPVPIPIDGTRQVRSRTEYWREKIAGNHRQGSCACSLAQSKSEPFSADR